MWLFPGSIPYRGDSHLLYVPDRGYEGTAIRWGMDCVPAHGARIGRHVAHLVGWIPINEAAMIELLAGAWVPQLCEKCGEEEIGQGRCLDHSVVCPICHEEPCNGDVPNPMCYGCMERE